MALLLVVLAVVTPILSVIFLKTRNFFKQLLFVWTSTTFILLFLWTINTVKPENPWFPICKVNENHACGYTTDEARKAVGLSVDTSKDLDWLNEFDTARSGEWCVYQQMPIWGKGMTFNTKENMEIIIKQNCRWHFTDLPIPALVDTLYGGDIIGFTISAFVHVNIVTIPYALIFSLFLALIARTRLGKTIQQSKFVQKMVSKKYIVVLILFFLLALIVFIEDRKEQSKAKANAIMVAQRPTLTPTPTKSLLPGDEVVKNFDVWFEKNYNSKSPRGSSSDYLLQRIQYLGTPHHNYYNYIIVYYIKEGYQSGNITKFSVNPVGNNFYMNQNCRADEGEYLSYNRWRDCTISERYDDKYKIFNYLKINGVWEEVDENVFVK